MSRLRVGAVGSFSREHVGDLLAPRVLENELQRRLGEISFRWFSQSPEPLAMDGGFTAEPLPVPEDELDLIFEWDGPELALLAGRVFSPRLLEQRLADLRLLERLPLAGSGVVAIQGGEELLPRAAEIAYAALESGLDPVLVEAEPCNGDASFADALAERLGSWRVPMAGVEDVVATIGEARLLLASSPPALAIAAALGTPARNLGDGAALGEAAEAERLLDEIAARGSAKRAGEEPGPEPILRTAHRARGRRLLEERLRWLDRHEELARAALTARSERDHAVARAEWLEAQLEQIWDSRSWRMLERARVLVARLRRVRT